MKTHTIYNTIVLNPATSRVTSKKHTKYGTESMIALAFIISL